MKYWVKLDENQRFVTFESGTVHHEPNWYEINESLVDKVLSYKYNCEFVFDGNKIIDVTGEPYVVETQPPTIPLDEHIKDLEQQNAELLLDLALKDGRIEELEQAQAQLFLDLTMKGVV